MTGSTRKVEKSIEEKLREEFSRTFGPMGSQVFDEQAGKGLDEKSLMDFADSCVSDKIIKKEEGERFKERLRIILKG
jgi:ribosomal protein S20